MKWAVKVRYLESPYSGDGKWHQKTTKWYADSEEAWNEADAFSAKNSKNWYESQGSLLHKE